MAISLPGEKETNLYAMFANGTNVMKQLSPLVSMKSCLVIAVGSIWCSLKGLMKAWENKLRKRVPRFIMERKKKKNQKWHLNTQSQRRESTNIVSRRGTVKQGYLFSSNTHIICVLKSSAAGIGLLVKQDREILYFHLLKLYTSLVRFLHLCATNYFAATREGLWTPALQNPVQRQSGW